MFFDTLLIDHFSSFPFFFVLFFLSIRISRSLRECCSCKESIVVLNAVSLMCELVNSLSKISKGNCITDEIMINLLSSVTAKSVVIESSENLQPSENLDVPGKFISNL